jgi:hypothetical protein
MPENSDVPTPHRRTPEEIAVMPLRKQLAREEAGRMKLTKQVEAFDARIDALKKKIALVLDETPLPAIVGAPAEAAE